MSVALSAVATVLFASAASAEPVDNAGQKDQLTYKVVPYVITDPHLVKNPQLILDELAKRGDLSGLGISPADGGPSKIHGRAAVAEPRSYVVDSSRFPRGSLPSDRYDYAEFSECTASGSEAYNDEGWIKNRYSYCQNHVIVMPAYVCGLFPPSCRQVGTYMSVNTMIGYGKQEGWDFQGLPEWRFADFYLDVNVLQATGPFADPRATMEAEIECDGDYPGQPPSGVDPDNACVPGGRDVTERPISEWRVNRGADFDIGSEGVAPAADKGEQIAVGEFYFDYDFDLPGAWVQLFDPESPAGGMRFDSAWYNQQSTKGSVFDRATPGFSFTKSDPDVAGAAVHIEEARANPAATVPTKPDKVLHGATPSDPLHRLPRAKSEGHRVRADHNRDVSTNFCDTVAMPPKPPTGGPYDCDEYALASTYEGAAQFYHDEQPQNELNYSVRWVNSEQNQEAGRRIGRWYENDRILDREAFFIPIRP
ncbi:hypothetical protein [Lentzea xinjiangensis]|nr:hypothetical protein [Lentzea xinjiangensis]